MFAETWFKSHTYFSPKCSPNFFLNCWKSQIIAGRQCIYKNWLYYFIMFILFQENVRSFCKECQEKKGSQVRRPKKDPALPVSRRNLSSVRSPGAPTSASTRSGSAASSARRRYTWPRRPARPRFSPSQFQKIYPIFRQMKQLSLEFFETLISQYHSHQNPWNWIFF